MKPVLAVGGAGLNMASMVVAEASADPGAQELGWPLWGMPLLDQRLECPPTHTSRTNFQRRTIPGMRHDLRLGSSLSLHSQSWRRGSRWHTTASTTVNFTCIDKIIQKQPGAPEMINPQMTNTHLKKKLVFDHPWSKMGESYETGGCNIGFKPKNPLTMNRFLKWNWPWNCQLSNFNEQNAWIYIFLFNMTSF